MAWHEKLNGWQRLWLVLSILYSIPISLSAFQEIMISKERNPSDPILSRIAQMYPGLDIQQSPRRYREHATKAGTQIQPSNSSRIQLYHAVWDDETPDLSKIVMRHFFLWIIPTVSLYMLAVALGWVVKGFKKTD